MFISQEYITSSADHRLILLFDSINEKKREEENEKGRRERGRKGRVE